VASRAPVRAAEPAFKVAAVRLFARLRPMPALVFAAMPVVQCAAGPTREFLTLVFKGALTPALARRLALQPPSIMYCVAVRKARLALGPTPRPALPALVPTAPPVLAAAPKGTFPKPSAEFRLTTPGLAPAPTLAPEQTWMAAPERTLTVECAGTLTAAPERTLTVECAGTLTAAPGQTLTAGSEGTWTAAPGQTWMVALLRGLAMQAASLPIGRVARARTCAASAVI
jgi:hypothetical protein